MILTTKRAMHGQQNLRDVLRQAEHTLETAIEEIDTAKPHDLLDSLAASRLLVVTARKRLDESAIG